MYARFKLLERCDDLKDQGEQNGEPDCGYWRHAQCIAGEIQDCSGRFRKKVWIEKQWKAALSRAQIRDQVINNSYQQHRRHGAKRLSLKLPDVQYERGVEVDRKNNIPKDKQRQTE